MANKITRDDVLRECRVQSHVGACWCAEILGVSLVTFGIVFVAAGIWLIALLGSWYYLIAGICLIAAGVMMIRREIGSVPICFAIWMFTILYAVLEARLDGWPLVLWIMAPTLLMLLVLVASPAFNKRKLVRPRVPFRDHSIT